MNYLFDTNVVSAARRPARLPRQMVDWLSSVPETCCFLSVITVMEIEFGVLRLERSDAAQGAVLRRWKSTVVAESFRDRILPVDETVAETCAGLRFPNPRPLLDALIAATAIRHQLMVVTRNTADFEPMGVRTLNPWTL